MHRHRIVGRFAVHVPGVIKDGGQIIGPRHRTDFRKWARKTMARRMGKTVPRLVNVRCGLLQSVVAHWICVTYLLKGFDRSAVLVPRLGSGPSEEVLLADVLPFPYRSAGDVIGRRLFISGNLGPARRKIGMPAGFEFMLPMKPDISALEIVPEADSLPLCIKLQPLDCDFAVDDDERAGRKRYRGVATPKKVLELLEGSHARFPQSRQQNSSGTEPVRSGGRSAGITKSSFSSRGFHLL